MTDTPAPNDMPDEIWITERNEEFDHPEMRCGEWINGRHVAGAVKYVRADLRAPAQPEPSLPLSKLREICEGLKLELRHYSVGGTPNENQRIMGHNAALDAVLEKAEKEAG